MILLLLALSFEIERTISCLFNWSQLCESSESANFSSVLLLLIISKAVARFN